MLLHSSPPNFLTKLIFIYDFIMRKNSGTVMSATTIIYFALKFGYMENIEGYIKLKLWKFQIKTIFYE